MKNILTISWVFLLGLIANASNENINITAFQTASSPNVSFKSGSGTFTCGMPQLNTKETLEIIKLRIDNAATIQERETIREQLEQILNESELLDFNK